VTFIGLYWLPWNPIYPALVAMAADSPLIEMDPEIAQRYGKGINDAFQKALKDPQVKFEVDSEFRSSTIPVHYWLSARRTQSSCRCFAFIMAWDPTTFYEPRCVADFDSGRNRPAIRIGDSCLIR
jgi:hypothetical protein